MKPDPKTLQTDTPEESARVLLRDPGFAEAVQRLAKRYSDGILATVPAESTIREELYTKHSVLTDVVNELADMARDVQNFTNEPE